MVHTEHLFEALHLHEPAADRATSHSYASNADSANSKKWVQQLRVFGDFAQPRHHSQRALEPLNSCFFLSMGG